MTLTQRFRPWILGCALALGAALSGQAQTDLFAPVMRVNDRVITKFEVEQRALFFQLLNAPGNLQEVAMERLIEERLQMDAAGQLGIAVEDEEIQAGMEEFASRVELSAEQFIAALAQAGVDEETFRDFIRAGVTWRTLVGSQFAARSQVSEAEIDRAVALGDAVNGVRVLISEIFLPADTPERLAAAQRRAERLSRISTLSAFASAARQFSAAPSRGRGGRQDWIPVGNLPPSIRGQILALSPGQVTDPIPVSGAIALFQLRDIEETAAQSAQTVSVEFARYFIPGGRTEKTLAEAARIARSVDTCDDLYGVVAGAPEGQLLRDVLPTGEIAGDIAVELAKLDENEVSTSLTTADGQALVLLMLCGRTLALSEEADREIIRQNLTSQRIDSYASGFLSELKADAIIQPLR